MMRSDYARAVMRMQSKLIYEVCIYPVVPQFQFEWDTVVMHFVQVVLDQYIDEYNPGSYTDASKMVRI